jgi:hypothetical protein
MDNKEFEKFMNEQIQEIEKHKWIESEKAGRDLGNCCVFDWIEKYSPSFYENYVKKTD